MPFTVARFDRVLVTRWTDLNIADLARATRVIHETLAEIGRPLLYVSVIEADARVPNSAERSALGDFAEQNMKLCEAVYLIFEGDSLKQRLQRTMMTGILLFAQESRVKTTVHRSAREAFGDLARRLQLPVDELAAQLERHGLV